MQIDYHKYSSLGPPRELYEDIESSTLLVGEILSEISPKWKHANFSVKDLRYEDEFRPKYLLLATMEDDSDKSYAVYIHDTSKHTFEKFLAEIKKRENDKQRTSIVLTTKKEHVSKAVSDIEIRAITKKQFMTFEYTAYEPRAEIKNLSFILKKDTKETEYTKEKLHELLDTVIDLENGSNRVTEVLLDEIIDAVSENVLLSENFDISTEEEFKKKNVEIPDYSGLIDYISTKHPCTGIRLKFEIKRVAQTCDILLQKENGTFGKVLIKSSGNFINIQDILNPTTDGYFQSFQNLFRELLPHMIAADKDIDMNTFVTPVLTCSNDLTILRDYMRGIISVHSSPHNLKSVYSRFIEALHGFEAALRSLYKTEKKLVGYNPEDVTEGEFLPQIQTDYVNAVYAYLNSWYSLMGTLAHFLSDSTVIRGKKISKHSLTNQLKIYPGILNNNEKDLYKILNTTRNVRSQVVAHPMARGAYKWATLNSFGAGNIVFFTNRFHNGGLKYNEDYLTTYKTGSHYDGQISPFKHNKEDLYSEIFPVPHSNMIFLSTLELIKDVFEYSYQNRQSLISTQHTSS